MTTGNLASVVLAPLVALIGVWLGGWITARSTRQAADLERQHRSMEELRRSYAGYLTACRQFADYLKQPAHRIEARSSADGSLTVPLLSPEGVALRQAVEAVSADLLLAARSSAIVDRARLLRVAVIRLAVVRATSPDGIIPDRDITAFRSAEQAYVDAVRSDLGMPAMDVSLWTSPPEVQPGPRL